jgi:hypothetical protein
VTATKSTSPAPFVNLNTIGAARTATVLTITARDLRPGDIVLDDAGDRRHGTFDAHLRGDVMRVWQPMTDLADGRDEVIDYPADTSLVVSRLS